MHRRDFVKVVVGSTAVWPFTARAQQPVLPVIGFLCSASPQPWENYVAAFRAGLKDAGYVDGQNVTIEFRWAEGHYDRLADMAADLARRNVNVLVATGGLPSVVAAKAATSIVPIVFTTGSDPVRLGIVASLSRPAGNMTGVSLFVTELDAKRLDLLRALVPGVQLIVVLFNPTRPEHASQMKRVQEGARTVGQQIRILLASDEAAINAAFASAAQLHAGAMLVGSDPFFNSERDKIVRLAAHYAIPAMYEQREHAVAGGLMSYGTNLSDGYRQAGLYAGRILKGEKPGDLPVVQSAKFELVINLKTAKALGLTIPQGLLNAADEVIE